jgi:hypothetical protein
MTRTTQIQLSLIPPASGLCTADGTPDARAIRKTIFPGLTSEKFATVLGVPVRTYRSWESGDRLPSGAALSLLKIAAAAPELVREILNGNEIDNDIITVTSLPMAKSERNSLMTA